jgi:GMP synthase (glutamine-hydrolysing)
MKGDTLRGVPSIGTAITSPKRILLINAVVWSSAYPVSNPLRNVEHWYARWLEGLPDITLTTLSASAQVLATVRAGVDAVIISGSPRDAWSDDPVNLRLAQVITTCQERAIPLLGVCYGHQLLARVLGGLVAPHPLGLELGNTPVELTAAGQHSPLFHSLPRRFDVLSSHADAVLVLPPECELLAQGDFTVNQAFHWRNLLFGLQFHPETDPEVLRFIWAARRNTWRHKLSFDLDQRLDSLRPTPLAGTLLRNFALRCVPLHAV